MTMNATLTTYRVETTRPVRRGTTIHRTVVVRAESARAARILAENDYRALFGTGPTVFLTSVVDAR